MKSRAFNPTNTLLDVHWTSFSDCSAIHISTTCFCLCWGFTAQSTQWGHVERSQFTWPHVYWASLVLWVFNQYCAHSFTRNWQLPLLNQRKREWPQKIFHDQSPWKNIADLGGGWTHDLLVSSRTHIQMSHRGRPTTCCLCQKTYGKCPKNSNTKRLTKWHMQTVYCLPFH